MIIPIILFWSVATALFLIIIGKPEIDTNDPWCYLFPLTWVFFLLEGICESIKRYAE